MTKLSKFVDKKYHRPTQTHHHHHRLHKHHQRFDAFEIHDLFNIVDVHSLHYNGLPRSMDETDKLDSSFPDDVSLKSSQKPESSQKPKPTATNSSSTVPVTLPSDTLPENMYALYPGNMPTTTTLRASAERQMQQNAQAQLAAQAEEPALQEFQSQVEVHEDDGYTILMLAAKAGRMKVVRACLILAQSGQLEHHPNHRGTDGNSALMLAVENGHTEVACILVDAGTDVSLVNSKLETALAIACKRGNHRVAELILASGGSSSCGLPDKWGNTPLIHASRLGDVQLVEALLASGTANPEAEDNDGHTALTSACQNGHVATVKALLAGGVNADQRTRDNSTALIYCSQHGSPDITSLLIEAGADVNASNQSGANSVIQACRHGQAETLRLLIKAGADLNHSQQQGQTALKYAMVRSVVSLSPCLLQLLDAGVHIGCELHYAVSLGFTHVVEKFLKHGAEPMEVPTQPLFQAAGTRGILKVSPLSVALIFQNLKLAHLFIDSGFLTESDIKTLPNDANFRAYLGERCKRAALALVEERMRPWPLQVLCVNAASKLVGYESKARKDRVQVSGLPPSFQRRLSYECQFKE
ncbi:ankyrin repeat domain-containing protein 50 [Elysia marginata]|uniref:Ankyrin repeat domain-containing protein 50 n=1 Tax=Elysia marginata TaxID=1093978 RepID=A0AAV4GK37_9GAST|nr:ankyrin repeat domain-containing protein 50 [Elysia marginata]